METYQIVFIILIFLIIVLRVKKYFDTRSINEYSASEVKKMLKASNNILLLDVRTLKEYKSGAIKPSIHIPLHEIPVKFDQLKKYQSKEIICYCQSGSRSISAAIKLKKLGFNSSNMKGGYSTW
ncbi:MAG: rhodanese-like domain-containing protein [Ignavibacteriaceae bacterium]|jgi:rhodanese-related sulfurtransferase